MESYTVCTQIISEMSDRNMWMGFLMFGLGICLGIYYAKDDLAKFPSWPHWVKDIPEAGTKVSAGNPVCSIYAEANSPNEVKNLLYRRLRKIELSIKSINKL